MSIGPLVTLVVLLGVVFAGSLEVFLVVWAFVRFVLEVDLFFFVALFDE